ncbi:hypothetical protein ACFL6U_13965 [Planctomycetota bacterium]
MMGVGDVWPGAWYAREQHYLLRGKPKSDEDDNTSAGPVVSPQASACSITNLIPQYAASVSQAVSMLQDAIASIEDVAQCLPVFEQSVAEAGKRNLTSEVTARLASEAAAIIGAIEQMERSFYRCRSAVRPEFSITFDTQPVPVQALASLCCTWEQSGRNSDWIMALEQSAHESLQAVQNYYERAESWLQQLIQVAQSNMEREEQAFGIERADLSGQQISQWSAKLASAVSERPADLDTVHSMIVSTRVAILLHDPLES